MKHEYLIKMENLNMSFNEGKTEKELISDLVKSWERKDNFLPDIDLTKEEQALYKYYKKLTGKK